MHRLSLPLAGLSELNADLSEAAIDSHLAVGGPLLTQRLFLPSLERRIFLGALRKLRNEGNVCLFHWMGIIKKGVSACATGWVGKKNNLKRQPHCDNEARQTVTGGC